MPCIIILLPPLLDPSLQWLILVFRTCRHHRGSFLQHFWGVPPLNHGSFRHSWKGFLSSCSLCWHDCHAIRPFHAVATYSHARFSPLLCAWLLSSDEPGQHRRAFITNLNMQVPVPIVSINTFVWCLNQDSMTAFYVLSPLLDRNYRGPPFCCLIRRSGHVLPSNPFSPSLVC